MRVRRVVSVEVEYDRGWNEAIDEIAKWLRTWSDRAAISYNGRSPRAADSLAAAAKEIQLLKRPS